MLKKIYIDNYACLVNFTAELPSFSVLCGHNGAGKTSIFNALRIIRALVTGEIILGVDSKSLVNAKTLFLTQFGEKKNAVQTFELEILTGGHTFHYKLKIEQSIQLDQIPPFGIPQIIEEHVACDGI